MDLTHYMSLFVCNGYINIKILLNKHVMFDYVHLISSANYAIELPYLCNLCESIKNGEDLIYHNINSDSLSNTISYHDGYLFFEMFKPKYQEYKIPINEHNKDNILSELSKLKQLENPLLKNELPKFTELLV